MLFGHHHHGHDHGHGDHGHGHKDGHEHDHGHDFDLGQNAGSRLGLRLRVAVAALVLVGAVLAASMVTVLPGEAVVLTRFGSPGRVVVTPGLAWRAPAPIEGTITVDLRLRTTSAGLQDVGTKDGLRVLVQAYAAWQVGADPDHVRRFVRAVRNQPDEAAEQVRSFLGSALETTASRFPLSALINTDPSAVQLAVFEQLLRERVEGQMLEAYGITIRQVGIERLTLPSETLAATVARMRAERQTVAAQRMAEGQRIASEVRANAGRDARIAVADGRAEATAIEAASRVEAAGIYAKAYDGDPSLYVLLRSLDMLDTVVGDNTRLILRTDAAPFRSFVEGPAAPAVPAPAPAAARSAGQAAAPTLAETGAQ